MLSYYIHALTCSQAVPRGPTPAKIFFKAFTLNDTPFLCVFCMLKSQSDEISTLRSTIEQLKSTLEGLSKHNSSQGVISRDVNDPSAANSTPTSINQAPIPEKSSPQVERRFNVVSQVKPSCTYLQDTCKKSKKRARSMPSCKNTVLQDFQ